MSFDYQQWVNDLQSIPQHQYNQALRAMMEERDRRSAQRFVDESENIAASQYHNAVECERVDGVAVWQSPPARFAAYPSGATVHHEGKVWHNPGPSVAEGEPGVSEDWVSMEPEPEDMEPDPESLPE